MWAQRSYCGPMKFEKYYESLFDPYGFNFQPQPWIRTGFWVIGPLLEKYLIFIYQRKYLDLVTMYITYR